MIPRASHRIWLIVSSYLLLKCCLGHRETSVALKYNSDNNEKDTQLFHQASASAKHIFHRNLDNNQFFNDFQTDRSTNQRAAISFKITAKRKGASFSTPKSSAVNSRRNINVAYNNLDNVLHTTAVERREDFKSPRRQSNSGVAADKTAQNPSHLLHIPTPNVHKFPVNDGNDPSRKRRYQRSTNTVKSTQYTNNAPTDSGSSPPTFVEAKSFVRNDMFSSTQLETAADISMPATKLEHANDGSKTKAVHPHGRLLNDDINSEDNTQILHTETSPAVIDSLKASNLDQQISRNPPVVDTKLDSLVTHQGVHPSGRTVTFDAPKSAPTGEMKPGSQSFPPAEASGKMHPLSHLASERTKERPITASHSSVTTDSHHYGEEQPLVPPDAPGESSFILLDDSVYITPVHTHRNGTGSRIAGLPPAGTDLTLRSTDVLFGGRNFDEQIIFLNGPDLVETSAEQESAAGPVATSDGRRLMGKVARAIPPHQGNGKPEEPLALPLRPIIRDPADEQLAEDNVVVVYADQHETVRLNCEVDADITTGVWLKDGQIVHAMDKKSRTADIRFVRESFGALTISNVMLEDDGVWQCEAENARGFFFNGRPIKLIVLDPPKVPYLLIDSRRLDAGNMFIPVKENAELTLACVSEGGNPRPTLTWEVLLSPGLDRHAQKLSNDVLELQEIKKDKDKEPYKINTGAISEARLPAVYRVHHNARILCIMEHPTLKVRQNASILLDVQYTPSFAITRTPGFGYPLREGIEVSLKCDVDSNPPSTPLWQKDDGDPPVPQTGDGFLNFSSIRREHSGWYKCTSRHLNFQYSSIGYYLSVRYDPVDVTSEPVEQDLSLSPSSSSSSSSSSAPASSSAAFAPSNGAGSAIGGPFPGIVPIGTNSFKGGGQMEVELGGSVTLQCPQGSLGCWSHLDSASARLKGLGTGSYAHTGQFSLKDVVYQDAGTYKCVGSSSGNRKKLEMHPTATLAVRGVPKVTARNSTPAATAGTPLHLSVEFCSNPPAHAARWLHGDRIYTPGNQYGGEVFAYGFTDLPTQYCREARLTYVHMHEKVPKTFYFVVSSLGGVAEAVFKVNYTQRHKPNGSFSSSTGNGAGSHGNSFSSSSSSSSASSVSSVSSAGNINGGLSGYKIGPNTINTVPGNGLDDDEELMEPEEIHFPIFGTGGTASLTLPIIHSLVAASLSILLHFVHSWHPLAPPSWRIDTVTLHGSVR
ncbi:uncharacterized protein LOC125771564 [Anopheles funestus]|uniref:uncharacterized protein LOC125771564 n=1 Tax=Anopheles funestus TaxID=62324 RepID=UPI0020C5F51F|nr:uncharacterized protein LOC125771564 [Anopheles funestus]XP_049298246.1 uncharacterized protein LOC125771564 [Anopheles funestus]XP_049298247.1 uncharacterized protein LOC125771564 [Anopheles funestus]